MKTVHYVGLATVCVLAGCANKNAYIQQAQQTATLKMPNKIALQKSDPYYNIPQQVNTNIERPSLIPPGSSLQEPVVKNQPKQPATGNKTVAKLAPSKGSPMLTMADNQQKAWGRVGDALRETEYQILDQDASVASYYILDTTATGKQITEQTPIYRVFVKKKHQKNTSVVMLLSEKSEQVDPRTSRRILGTLAEQLA